MMTTQSLHSQASVQPCPSPDPHPDLTLNCVVEAAQSCPALCDPMDWSPTGSSCPWDSTSKNTGAGSHSLLQGIFLIQGSNPGFLYCRQILYRPNLQGSP